MATRLMHASRPVASIRFFGESPDEVRIKVWKGNHKERAEIGPFLDPSVSIFGTVIPQTIIAARLSHCNLPTGKFQSPRNRLISRG